MIIPKLTIALLSYNRAHMALASLEAILGQTYGDFEILFMDNHSSDETAELVLSCKDSRLIYVRQPPGKNPTENHHLSVWMARGEYVLPTHDDDIMAPRLLERYMAFLRRYPDTLALACNVSLIDEHGQQLQHRMYDMEEDRLFERGEYIKAYFDEKIWLPTPTNMHSRANLLDLKQGWVRAQQIGYEPSADILTMMQHNTYGRIAMLAEPLLSYRQHKMQESRLVDQSAPLYSVAQQLAKNYTVNPCLAAAAPMIEGALARYHAQHFLFESPLSIAEAVASLRLKEIKARWEDAIPSAARSNDAVLPFEILLNELGLGATIEFEELYRYNLEQQSVNPMTQAYRMWALAISKGQYLFSRTTFKRIAIFGSMLNAFLLVADAARCGVEVVCCLDSSPARVGNSVFGVPVCSHEEITKFANTVDAIVLSNERNHDESLLHLVRGYLTRCHEVPIFSWKDLASG